MDNTPEDIALAVEIIRQLENLEYPEHSILQAMIYVFQDTLKKLPSDKEKKDWQQRIVMALCTQSEAH
ncbi:hypothetical protein [Candidatus Sororendozoicomonas aggregata]|uniref:hypothetical protein n=1 Tax=Candidatus Sororendozoicomonas aggregata TaxID=3073239 RepID=UPI002ED1C539